MAAKANTPEGDRLDVLATLVEAYERTHSIEDLEPVIGRRNRVYEVLARRRARFAPASSAVPRSHAVEGAGTTVTSPSRTAQA